MSKTCRNDGFEMVITLSKLASLVIAAIYLVAAAVADGVTIDLLPIFMILAFVLALIWFPEWIGSRTNRERGFGMVDTESPAIMVAGLGWFFLVGMPLIVCLIQFFNS